MSKKRHTAVPVEGVEDGEPQVRTLAVRYPDGFVLDAHAHTWSQLLYASTGVMVVETERGSWVVPPLRAVWLKGNTVHRITMRGEVSMHTVYFDDRAGTPLAKTCVVEVKPLLRELLVYCAARGKLDAHVPHEGRLAGLLVDLVAELETVPLALPMPRDGRAVRVARAIKRDPGGDSTPAALARGAGASERTIERLFVHETGMTLGRWRKQARLLHALTLLAERMPVTEVALEVGYASPSAFISMFKDALGRTPSRYFS